MDNKQLIQFVMFLSKFTIEFLEKADLKNQYFYSTKYPSFGYGTNYFEFFNDLTLEEKNRFIDTFKSLQTGKKGNV